MEDTNITSQKVDLEHSESFLLATAEKIDDFMKQIPSDLWNLKTEEIDGPETFQQLTKMSNGLTKLAASVRGEVRSLE